DFMSKLRIAFIASEVAPLAKTGGLADVMGTLPLELERAGHRVAVFMPFYREVRKIARIEIHPALPSLPVHLAPGIREEVAILTGQLPGSKVQVFFVDHPRSFDRDHLYGTPDGDYPDNADRFILFSRAALQAIKELREEYDILHCHDWQTALIPAYLSRVYAGERLFARTASVFTIHNLAYQGVFPKETVVRTGLGWELFTPDQLEFYGKVNLMKSGILYAHKVSTVSPTYAHEIVTPESGFGLDGLLRTRASDLTGIRNGLNQEEWDPARDRHLKTMYSRKALAGKAECTAALREELGLPVPERNPVLLIGVVSRLAEQKGFELLVAAAAKLAKKPVQIVILGTGDRAIQEALEEACRKAPDRFIFRPKFDTGLAHRIYAGADALLMPSKYEPCGLGQMIAMRYGTL
ncbi:MAG: glycogen/starch synthase, partial [bacterium]